MTYSNVLLFGVIFEVKDIFGIYVRNRVNILDLFIDE